MKLILFSVVMTLITMMGCSFNDHPDESLYTASGQAWVYEKGQQKIAFTLNSGVYKNYLFDSELDIVVSSELGFHTNLNIIYFHADWYDENGNYIGIWGDSLYIAQNPGAPVNLFEYKISGKKLTLIKPGYSYIDKNQGAFLGDISYEFKKHSFTPPTTISNMSLNEYLMISNQISKNSLIATKPPILFSLKDEIEAFIRVYDIRGQVVKTIETTIEGNYILWPGTYEDGEPVPPGIYFYLIKTEDEVSIRDMVLLR